MAWNQVPGDYLEFGVYRGTSFAEAYRAIWANREKVRQHIGGDEIQKWYDNKPRFFAFITKLVGQGTIIIFDDWYRFKGSQDRGEQRACKEWLQKNPQIELTQFWQQGPQSVAFLVNVV